MVKIRAACGALAIALLSASCSTAFDPSDPEASYKNVYNDTSVEGHAITGGEKWSGTVNLLGSIEITRYGALVIAPGTVVTVASGSYIRIDIDIGGLLYAIGSSSAPIVLRSNGTGTSDWVGINKNGRISLEFCLLKNAINGIEVNYPYYTSIGSILGMQEYSNAELLLNRVCFYHCADGLTIVPNYYAEDLAPQLALKHLTFDTCQYGYSGCSYRSLKIDYCSFQGCGRGIDCSKECQISCCNFSSNSIDIDSQRLSAEVSIDNCYPVSPIVNMNLEGSPTITTTNGQASSVAGSGCGFDYSAYLD